MPRKLKSSPFADVAQSDFDIENSRLNNRLGVILAEERKKKGLSLDGLNKELAAYGVVIGSKSINKWETGISTPNAYQFLALCRALDIRDPMFVFTGDSAEALNEEGLKKVADYKDDLIASGRYKKPLAKLQPENAVPSESKIIHLRNMMISTLRVSAGTGSFLDDGNYEMQSFPDDEVPKDADFGVLISGDSMEPFYHDGQIAWVKKCREIRPGNVGVFLYDGEGYIKVYEEQIPTDIDSEVFSDNFIHAGPQPVLVSYNEKYPPKVISSELSFELIGKVLN